MIGQIRLIGLIGLIGLISFLVFCTIATLCTHTLTPYITMFESKRLTHDEQEWYYQHMSMTAEKLVSEALEMPGSIRAFVAERIIESLDVDAKIELSPAWKAEIERRCLEVEEGAITLLDANEVFKKAYARLS